MTPTVPCGATRRRSPFFESPLTTLRPWLVAVLTFMMFAVGTAQLRATVLFTLQESGVQRFYETEASIRTGAEVRPVVPKAGHRPAEDPASRSATGWPPAAQPAAGSRPLAEQAGGPSREPHPSGVRPHRPRAPPVA